ADAWLLHDREIHNRADDSIVCVAAGRERAFRRARGYVPRPVRVLREAGGTVLGVGAEMKGGFCLLRGQQAYNSQYLGELSEAGNVEFYRESLARMIGLLGEAPEVVVHDLHPDYFTTGLARTWPLEMPRESGLPRARRVMAVQHHFAHALSVLAELGEEAPETSLAVVLDGVGWGTDGTAWGGEFLLLEDRGRRWSRKAHLAPFELPGGDRAVLEPWRQALALLRRAFDRKVPEALRADLERCAGGADNLRAMEIMIDGRLNSPLSSGAGRLFDAVGYLLAGRDRITFEAQAAMEVEALAARAPQGVEPYPFDVREGPEDAPLLLDPAPAVRAIVEDLAEDRPREEMAAAFQSGLAASCGGLAARLLGSAGAKAVLLSGGCFQNVLLLEETAAVLEARGLDWYSNREVPVNDGGVALGQVAAAAWDVEQ
ncbi:MAG: Kae1-like domain-containing protein, partial [Planctomycetota bacterium]